MENNFWGDIRYAEHPTKVLEDYNAFFAYMLKDAWHQPISMVYVTNDKENNLHLLKEDTDKVSTINTNELKEVLKKYSKNFNDNIKEEIPLLPALDGYHNEVYFKVDNTWYTDDISNLTFYNKETIDNNKHLSTVFYLLDDAHKELSNQNNEIKDYFIIDDED